MAASSRLIHCLLRRKRCGITASGPGTILLHKAAKKAFDGLGVDKLPTVKELPEYGTQKYMDAVAIHRFE